MSCTQSDGLDRSFLVLVREVERGYHNLSKQDRLRIEKWIEKLCTGSYSNLVWKKQRNEYIKLLLHMVVSKKLSEPFHLFPPDGALPQFPKHTAIYYLKNKASDEHELFFWKNIYHRLEKNKDNNKSMTDMTVLSESKRNSDSDHNNDLNTSISINDQPVKRENNFLKLCDTEHKLRIELLEEKLRDEKLHYAMQVQKLHYVHKAELSSYMDVINSRSSFNINNSIDYSQRLNTSEDNQQYKSRCQRFSKEILNNDLDSPLRQNNNNDSRNVQSNNSFIQDNDNKQQDNNEQQMNIKNIDNDNPYRYLSPRKQQPSVNFSFYEKNDETNISPTENGISQSMFRGNEYEYIPKPQSSLSNIPNVDNSMYYLNNSKLLNNNNDTNNNNNNSNMRMYESIDKNEQQLSSNTKDMSDVSFEESKINSSYINNNRNSIQNFYSNNTDIDNQNNQFYQQKQIEKRVNQVNKSEDDFLIYIEEFQNNIKKLQNLSPSKKERSFIAK